MGKHRATLRAAVKRLQARRQVTTRTGARTGPHTKGERACSTSHKKPQRPHRPRLSVTLWSPSSSLSPCPGDGKTGWPTGQGTARQGVVSVVCKLKGVTDGDKPLGYIPSMPPGGTLPTWPIKRLDTSPIPKSSTWLMRVESQHAILSRARGSTIQRARRCRQPSTRCLPAQVNSGVENDDYTSSYCGKNRSAQSVG